MGKMKQKADEVKDLMDNGYDEESIALIADVTDAFIEEVKKNLGVKTNTVDVLENY